MHTMSTMPDNLTALSPVMSVARTQHPDAIAVDASSRALLVAEMGREVRLTSNYSESEELAEQACAYTRLPYVMGYDVDEDCWFAFTERKPVEVTFVSDAASLAAAADEARFHSENVQIIDDLVFVETDHKIRVITQGL